MQVSRWIPAALGLFVCLLVPARLAARQAAPPAEALRVFLDCNAFCDTDHLRREITYVNWMRDRQDADIHLLITSQGTGGGGQEYTLKYIGLRAFQGSDDELKFTTRQADTQDEIRRQVSQRIALGLARYLARGAFADRLKVTYTAPAGAVGATQQPKDPWNLWVMSAGVNANFNGESQNSSNSYSGRLSARRVAEKWKFSASVRGSRNNSRYELEDQTLRTHRSNYSFSSQLVRSLGDHWSFGTDL